MVDSKMNIIILNKMTPPKIKLKKESCFNQDWVSDCCGAKLCQKEAIGGSPFICGNCGKQCQVKQFHDISIHII